MNSRKQIDDEIKYIIVKREYIAILFALLVFFGVMEANGVFESLVEDYQNNTLARYLVKIGSYLLIFLVLLKISQVNHLQQFLGLNQRFKNKYLLAGPLLFISIGVVITSPLFRDIPLFLILLFVMENLLAGFTEEMCVRGLMFPLIVKANNNRRQIILISALLSSIIFGLLHYSNLKNQPGNFEGITSQVVFGFAIGMYFCGLLLRTENILVPAVMHGLFNITFGPKNIMLTPVSNISDQRETQFFDWSSFVSTSIVFLLILFIGIFMIRKADKQSVFRKLLEES
jgi:hypothetical protein